MLKNDIYEEPTGPVPVVVSTDVLVVGGGPSGIAAAVAAARNGASVTLVERYAHLGGLAAGGMVLVLDDMNNGTEISVRGICAEMIKRMTDYGLCVTPPAEEWSSDQAVFEKWARWGLYDFHSHSKPQPICYASAFDPDAFKRVATEMVNEAGVNLRLHSWFSKTIVENNVVRGVVCETKAGRQALLGKVVIDATGDLDVAASAGADFAHGKFIVTTVFRLGGVDVERAEKFEYGNPEEFAALDREAKRIMGGSWERWWLKTPLPGIVWCNCPHMSGYDGLSVQDLTSADAKGRQKIAELVAFIRAKMPGFEEAFVVDVAPQLGVRQTRVLEGEYVVTKEDVIGRRHYADSVARGRDYYYPYRALLPKKIDQLLVAGRHYSATPSAQRISREIPPCMAMGEAAGTAAAVAILASASIRDVDVAEVQRRLRSQGADPGDLPAANATFQSEAAEQVASHA
ncbi:FAD-dependent oxidoreductase [Rhizobium laguerreae]|jgi:hypothetical protein|uniref:FAD-dependent oxidoreductase n=1 Tax=Rhizobium laguerreae TaxID=1076926 RepID=UPI001C90CAB9|nr:FAD-dependent oxidoreductase [Rhizobium laguerreae]MBY3307708.1 FAD-dependent oxidoreductase [Rhizobium laguerreae]